MDNILYIKVGEEFDIVQAFPQSTSGDSVVIEVRKLSDDYTWNFTSLTFGAVAASALMTSVTGGVWKKSFTPDEEDTYIATMTCTFADGTPSAPYYQILKGTGSSDATSFASNSEVSIVNAALTLLGAERITAIDDTSENARRANAIYAYCRDELLRCHPWNFATTRAALAQLATAPTSGYDHAYQLPSNCLRVLEVANGTDIDDQITEFLIEGRELQTDEDTVYIKYIYRHANPSQYDASFIAAFAAKLAMELAYPITMNRGVSSDMAQLYQQRLETAKAMDGQESNSVTLVDEDYFIDARE